MNMKTLILSSVIALTACQTTAKEEKVEVEDKFDKTAGFYNSAGLGYTVQDSKGEINLSITLSTAGNAIPSFLIFNRECKRFSKKEMPVNSSKINNQLVRMVKQCWKQDWYAFSPQSKAGQDFIIDILKTRSVLEIDEYKFNTKGYNHYSKLLENEEGGL